MASQELTHRPQHGALQQELADLGIQVREADGLRVYEVPPELAKRANVLTPVSEVTQADPNFTPSLRVIVLQKERHAYFDKRQKKWALSKLGLLALAHAAGVSIESTERIDRGKLLEGEIGWAATVTMRRSDGTPQRMTAHKISDMALERWKVQQQCIDRDSGEVDQGRFMRRWAEEREVMDAKLETKAILRAIRAVIQTPHAFDEAEIAKPFVVLGYNFTPDYSDPLVRQALVDRAFGPSGRAAQLYGPPEADEPGVIESGHATAERQIAPPPAREISTGGALHGAEPAEAGSGSPAAPPVEQPTERMPPGQGEIPTDAPASAGPGDVVMTWGNHKGKTLSQIADADPEYLAYVLRQKATTDGDRKLHDAIRAYQDAQQ